MGEVLTSGTTEEEHRQFLELSDRVSLYEHVINLPEPLRLENYTQFASSIGLDAWLPVTVWAGLAAPIRHQGEPMGIIWLGHDIEDRKFSDEDVETLVMFASQAALVISNAHRYRDEQTGQDRPRDPDQHLTGGCGGLRHQGRYSRIGQPGGGENCRCAAGPGHAGGRTSWTP